MGWSLGFDSQLNRDIGYGVPAYCDHPGCDVEIDRGLAYVCGSEPYGGDHGCGMHFCEDHRFFATKGRGKNADTAELCARCKRNRPHFPIKEDHPTWINHKLTDPSWAEWREKYPEETAALSASLVSLLTS